MQTRVLSALILILFFNSLMAQKQTYDYASQWKKIEDLISKKGLPLAAGVEVDKLYDQAKKEGNSPQTIKALVYKMQIVQSREEDATPQQIEALSRELKGSKEPQTSLLHSLIGSSYWQFLQQNRWKLYDRTTIQGKRSSDITTWSADDLHDEIMAHYMASIKDPLKLVQLKLDAYDPIITKGNSRSLRPTLYDLLAHQALEYFTNPERTITKPAYAFLLSDPDAFSAAESFSKTKFSTKDTTSLDYQAILIYQQLTRFHLNDQDPAALIDLELERLEYMNRTSIQIEKESFYRNALEELSKRYPNREDAALAVFRVLNMDMGHASEYDPGSGKTSQRDGYSKVKLGLEELENKFPGSPAALQAHNLLQTILQPSLKIVSEQVNLPGKPFRVLVSFKNTERIHYRIIPAGDDLKDENTDQWSDTYWDKLRKLTPLKIGTVELPQLLDHREHKVEIKLDPLPLGSYILLAGTMEDLPLDKNPMSVTYFDVTNIGWFNNGADYFIVDRETGQPLPEAKVQVWQSSYDYTLRRSLETKKELLVADMDGHVKLTNQIPGNTNTRLEVHWQQDHYFPKQIQFQSYRPSRVEDKDVDADQYEKNNRSIFFFTDRGIYRPGQTVHFKGIIITRDSRSKKYKIVVGLGTTIHLRNANGDLVDSIASSTNEFGSVSGSFKVPQQSLTGDFSIYADARPEDQARFKVEEYKRPKFFTEIKNPTGDHRLNDTVTIIGQTRAYAGNAINGARVNYRVTRRSRFMDPIWMRLPWRPTSPQEITNGFTTTQYDGTYTISFAAIPDRSIDPGANPFFDYMVTADVTDINGETRSTEKIITIGYRSLQVQVNINEKEPIYSDSTISVVVTAQNLSGEPEKVPYSMSVYKLNAPDQLIRPRYWEAPDTFLMNKEEYRKWFPFDDYADDLNKSYWPRSSAMFTIQDITGNKPIGLTFTSLTPGWYLAEIHALDKYGQSVTAYQYLQIFDRRSGMGGVPEYFTTSMDKTKVEPGTYVQMQLRTDATDLWIVQERTDLMGSTAKHPQPKTKIRPPTKSVSDQTDAKHPFVILRMNKEKLDNDILVTEDERGGFGFNHAFVKHNRFFNMSSLVEVPWTNKELDIRFASFRDKTQPGSQEEWTVIVKGKTGDKLASEVLTSMYDVSLDQFTPFSWASPSLFPHMNRTLNWQSLAGFNAAPNQERVLGPAYESIPEKKYDQLLWAESGRRFTTYHDMMVRPMLAMAEAQPTEMMDSGTVRRNKEAQIAIPSATPVNAMNTDSNNKRTQDHGDPTAGLHIRTDFNETAFFFPDLKTDLEGNVQFKFTMPEALTQWKAQVFAHTKDLSMGSTTTSIVTSKELMVQPNVPRFLREGDKINLSAKVANLTGKEITGHAQLELIDPETRNTVDGWFKNTFPIQYFSVPDGQSIAVRFDFEVPTNFNKPLLYRIVAISGSMSDGEEAEIPVLTNRQLVTESKPILMKGDGTQKFSLDKLLKNTSPSLTHHALTVEFSSNPAWYAVQSLPYLADYPQDCAEQIFNRFYANALAEKVIEKAPKIKAYYEKWVADSSNEAALLSNLQKNKELKSVLLQETPWVMEAKNEAEQKKNIALLFDMARISQALNSNLEKLSQLQSPNGGFVWFPGGPDDRFITQYIASAIGHLQKLQAVPTEHNVALTQIQRKAINYLDQLISEDYSELIRLQGDQKKHQLSSLQIQYLYARSMVMNMPLPEKSKRAYTFYMNQSAHYWLQHSKMEQAMIALVQQRAGNEKTANAIMASLKQYALQSPTIGMYWKDVTSGYYWHQAPVETQALLIEAFAEVAKDEASVESMKQWLLTQKQTNSWKSTKATADAVFALLLQGQNWAAATPEVSIKLGEQSPFIMQSSPADQAGTGYFKKVVDGKSISNEMGKIQVTINGTAGKQALSWGAVYWQYFESLDAITPANSPFSLKKQLYIETTSDKGPVLKAIEDKEIKVGNKIIVRVELRADRDMEYVYMKDMRASGTEPLNVLSQYKWQGGLGYYESIRDASTNFFFSYLPKGTYVFEYPLFVSAEGEFSVGIAEVQCMYAPEFAAHSEGMRIRVKE